MENKTEFKDKLKSLRESKGVSQAKLAEDIYVSRSAIAKWENGLGLPSEESVLRLCEYFGVERSSIIGDDATENILIAKNKKLVKQKNIIITILSIMLSLLIIFFAVEACSLIYSDYNPFTTKVVNNVRYTRVNDGRNIYYRVDGVHRDGKVSNYMEVLELKDSIDGTRVTAIAPYAFRDMMFGEIILNNSLESIGECAFLRASADKITFGTSLETIDDYAFAYSDIPRFEIPDSVKSLGGFAFYCSEAEEVSLSEGIGEVMPMTFGLCTFLKNITVKGAPAFRMKALYYCSVEQITLINADAIISDYAFLHVPLLDRIQYGGETSAFLNAFTPVQLGVNKIGLCAEGQNQFTCFEFSQHDNSWIESQNQ